MKAAAFLRRYGLILLLVSVLPLAALDIALPENSGEYEKLAAEELLSALRAGGVGPVRIVPEKQAVSPAVHLGDSLLAREAGINPASAGPEEWILRKHGSDLIVSGGRPVGTLYGVYALLRHLGVYFLALDETRIPTLNLDALPNLNERKSPAIAGRQMFNRYPNWFRDHGAKQADAAFWKYYLRNGFNGTTPAFNAKVLYLGDEMRWTDQVHFVHNFYSFVPPEKYFKDHPEYFSMNREGKRYFNPYRRESQLCLSNPAVAEITAAELKRIIRHDRAKLQPGKAPLVYNLTPNDASNHLCFCPECKKIVQEEGCETGLLLRFINRVAESVRQEFPGIRLLTRGAMGSEALPAVTKPLPGIGVYYADDFIKTSCFVPLTAEQKAKIRRWTDAFPGSMVWDYWNMGLGAYFNPPRPEVVYDAMIEDVRWFAQCGVGSLFVEAERDFFIPQNFLDLEYFLLGQLMLNPSADADRLTSIFLEGYYGPAAPAMRHYLDALRAGIKRQKKMQTACAAVRWDFLTAQFMLDNYRLLNDALKAVPSDSRYHVRIAAECLPLFWSIVYYRGETDPVFAKAGLRIDDVRQQVRTLAYEVLDMYRPAPKKLAASQKKLDARLAQLEAELTVPKEFAALNTVCRVFGAPHLRRVAHSRARAVADPEALTGQAVVSDFHKSASFERPTTRVFSFYDFTIRKNDNVTAVPEDEKYHWYRIPKVRLSQNCIFTAHLWMIQLDLSQGWEFPHAGDPAINDADLYFRAKFTGPAFVKGSAQPNAVRVDCVVLVRLPAPEPELPDRGKQIVPAPAKKKPKKR